MTKILIVDDQKTNRSLIKKILTDTNAGYEILEAESFAAALEILKGPVPSDLILMDVVMPEVDGIEACGRLKADPAMRDILK